MTIVLWNTLRHLLLTGFSTEESNGKTASAKSFRAQLLGVCVRERKCVCVCERVREREMKERKKEREREGERQRVREGVSVCEFQTLVLHTPRVLLHGNRLFAGGDRRD